MSETLILADVQWGDFVFYLVTFLILMWLIKHFAWGPVTTMMEKRAQKITDDLTNAQNARKDAESLQQQRQEALDETHVQAAQIIDRAKQNGEQQKNTLVDEANAEVKTLKQNAQVDIEQQRQEALANVKDDVADLALEIATKVIGKELSAADHKALVDSYIEGLGKQHETK